MTLKMQVCTFEPHVLPPLSSRLLHVQRVFPVCSADSIEANVETADTHVQSGTQQLARAADYQVKLDRTREYDEEER